MSNRQFLNTSSFTSLLIPAVRNLGLRNPEITDFSPNASGSQQKGTWGPSRQAEHGPVMHPCGKGSHWHLGLRGSSSASIARTSFLSALLRPHLSAAPALGPRSTPRTRPQLRVPAEGH